MSKDENAPPDDEIRRGQDNRTNQRVSNERLRRAEALGASAIRLLRAAQSPELAEWHRALVISAEFRLREGSRELAVTLS